MLVSNSLFEYFLLSTKYPMKQAIPPTTTAPTNGQLSICSLKRSRTKYGLSNPKPSKTVGAKSPKLKVLSSSRLSFIPKAPRATASNISSAFARKGVCQSKSLVMTGPKTGPRTMPLIPAPRHSSHPSWRMLPDIVVTNTPPVEVRISPAHRPISTRTSRRVQKFSMSTPHNAVTENTRPEMMNIRLRPMMSHNRPPAIATMISATE